MYMKTRHECIGQTDDTTCNAEKVKIHHVDFAAAPLRNEYIIDTHPYDSKTRAYYHKDKNHGEKYLEDKSFAGEIHWGEGC